MDAAGRRQAAFPGRVEPTGVRVGHRLGQVPVMVRRADQRRTDEGSGPLQSGACFPGDRAGGTPARAAPNPAKSTPRLDDAGRDLDRRRRFVVPLAGGGNPPYGHPGAMVAVGPRQGPGAGRVPQTGGENRRDQGPTGRAGPRPGRGVRLGLEEAAPRFRRGQAGLAILGPLQ